MLCHDASLIRDFLPAPRAPQYATNNQCAVSAQPTTSAQSVRNQQPVRNQCATSAQPTNEDANPTMKATLIRASDLLDGVTFTRAIQTVDYNDAIAVQESFVDWIVQKRTAQAPASAMLSSTGSAATESLSFPPPPPPFDAFLGDDQHATGWLWGLEHPAVYTAGISARPSDVLETQIPVIETRRGGKHTYHGPGQLVVYCMLSLDRYANDVRRYIRAMEQWIIDGLNILDVAAFTAEGRVG
ncbi:MAG: hypothetical protein K0U36_04995, partial [Alphaproteobacteria bacterium]|nr:hypothetical protein [Alphaproteobacteria bacterium]